MTFREVLYKQTLLFFFVFAVQAEAIVDMIGFPEFILNATKLDERYEGVCAVHRTVKFNVS